MTSEIESAWYAAVDGLDGDGPLRRAALDDLLTRYREPGRQYHTAVHMAAVVQGVLRFANTPEPQCDDLHATVAAAFFHDAVYDPQADDNERRSAELAINSLTAAFVPPDRSQRVASLVLTTIDHLPPEDEGLRRDAAVLSDADLAVLASPPEDYRVFAASVRAEYAFVPEPQWREARAAFIDSMLDREHIYRTAGAQHLEAVARANLQAERDALIGGTP